MNCAKRLGALIVACAMLLGALPLAVLADSVDTTPRSVHGAFAVELNGTVYATRLNDGSDYELYRVTNSGGDFEQIDSAPELGDLVVGNGVLYYLRERDGAPQVMMLDESGTPSLFSGSWEADVTVTNLTWYDDVLLCLANERIYMLDPVNGEPDVLSEDILVEDFTIIDSVIFYISASDRVPYTKTVPNQEAPVTRSAGTLWSMDFTASNPEKLLEKGVDKLRAYGDNLFYHNLDDSYPMGSGEDIWLEGKLYRYNVETGQTASLGLNYDWDFYPTPHGLLVYTSQDISMHPLTGGEPTQLMRPEVKTDITADDNNAYVYEYTQRKLTQVPLDASEPIVLMDESDVLPSDEFDPGDDLIFPEGTNSGADGTDDTASDDSGSTSPSTGTDSSYIFPNSSKKKLTRAQILDVKKSLWGYARNEIYARHGYKFTKSEYKNYFAKKSWYKPGGFSSSSLNSIEWYNMELIKSLEIEHGLLEGTSSDPSTSSPNPSAKNNHYVLKEARTRKLTKKYLRNKLGSKSQYALARNEILARRGYVFKTEKYKTYFNNQKWYSPGGYSSSKLSNTEWYNIEQLKALENE